MEFDLMLKDMTEAVRAAGEIIRSARDIDAHTREKTAPCDLVTDYDVAAEKLLRQRRTVS